MSLLASFEIGTRSLRTFQTAIQTVSHNISNVNTPGYSRQRIVLTTEHPDRTDRFDVGRGVRMMGVERLRDAFFEASWRRETTGQGQAEALATAFKSAEALFPEPNGDGLSTRMDKFWSAWQELANHPTDPGIRAVVLTRGADLAAGLNQTLQGIAQQRADADSEIAAAVPQINSTAREIYQLNDSIKTALLNGQTPNDALDRRDFLVGQLSQWTSIQVVDHADGSVAVYAGGAPLVEEGRVGSLETLPRAGDPEGHLEIRWKETGDVFEPIGGRLGGWTTARDVVLPGLAQSLADWSRTLRDEVNALHRTGVGLDGSTSLRGAVNFTGTLAADATVSLNGVDIALNAGDDLATVVSRLNAQEAATGVHAAVDGARLVLAPGGATPQTVHVTGDPDGAWKSLGIVNDFFAGEPGALALSDAVRNNPDAVAASASGAPGDNTLARALAGLRDKKALSGGTTSFDGSYQGFLADLGARSAAAQASQENQSFLLQQIDQLRESVSGVSLDEELTDLIRYQRSYEMAARSIQTADEMLGTLLDMVHR
ncbi:MAG TPA: flagellar hook-associated protein FlgK [Elusimicrobiota bacterium]|nr:flagellar hook-associated protein FlgK [Elusimicrobiota bacterium]HND63692.1 flagellar hook-associated protein FlgK [Elusimicrobiota bacterium]